MAAEGESGKLKEAFKDIPSWVWLGAAVAGAGLFLLTRNSGSAGTALANPAQLSTPTDTSGGGAIGASSPTSTGPDAYETALAAQLAALQAQLSAGGSAGGGPNQPPIPTPGNTASTGPVAPSAGGAPAAGAPSPTGGPGVVMQQPNGNPYWFNPPVPVAAAPSPAAAVQAALPAAAPSVPVPGATITPSSHAQQLTQQANAQQQQLAAGRAPVDPTTGLTAAQLLNAPRAYPGGPVVSQAPVKGARIPS